MARYVEKNTISKGGLLLLRTLGVRRSYSRVGTAEGREGVGQMVAWEEDDLTTSKLRGFDPEKLSTFFDFRDRIFSRITLEAYGKTIDYFQSREEFLYAFRDAVAGKSFFLSLTPCFWYL